jgi:hypothetical protein
VFVSEAQLHILFLKSHIMAVSCSAHDLSDEIHETADSLPRGCTVS